MASDIFEAVRTGDGVEMETDLTRMPGFQADKGSTKASTEGETPTIAENRQEVARLEDQPNVERDPEDESVGGSETGMDPSRPTMLEDVAYHATDATKQRDMERELMQNHEQGKTRVQERKDRETRDAESANADGDNEPSLMNRLTSNSPGKTTDANVNVDVGEVGGLASLLQTLGGVL